MSLWYILSGLSLFYILIGRILTIQNAPYLLSGYNTLPADEQKKVDLAAYVPFWRRFHLWLGLGHFIVGSLLYHLWSDMPPVCSSEFVRSSPTCGLWAAPADLWPVFRKVRCA